MRRQPEGFVWQVQTSHWEYVGILGSAVFMAEMDLCQNWGYPFWEWCPLGFMATHPKEALFRQRCLCAAPEGCLHEYGCLRLFLLQRERTPKKWWGVRSVVFKKIRESCSTVREVLSKLPVVYGRLRSFADSLNFDHKNYSPDPVTAPHHRRPWTALTDPLEYVSKQELERWHASNKVTPTWRKVHRLFHSAR